MIWPDPRWGGHPKKRRGPTRPPLRRPRHDTELRARARERDWNGGVVQPAVFRELRAVHIHDGRVGHGTEGYDGVEREVVGLPDRYLIAHVGATSQFRRLAVANPHSRKSDCDAVINRLCLRRGPGFVSI